MQLTKRQALALVKVIDKHVSYLSGDAAQELVELQGELEDFVLSSNSDGAADDVDDDEPTKAWSDDEDDGYDGLRCEEDEDDSAGPNGEEVKGQVTVGELISLCTARSDGDDVTFAPGDRTTDTVDLVIGDDVFSDVAYLERSALSLCAWDVHGDDWAFSVSKFPPEWTALLPCNSLVEVVGE